jgi:hypothetical protein
VFNRCSIPKHIKVHLYSIFGEQKVKISKLPATIRPHKKAESLECHWELISFDSQLNYIIKKFPDLKKLTISLFSDEALGLSSTYYQKSLTPSTRPSATTFVAFLKYVFSIPTFLVTLVLKNESIRFVWETLKEIKGANDNVRLIFNLEQNNGFTRNMATRFKKHQSVIYFRYYTSLRNLPDTRFLDSAGPYIGLLQIRNEESLRNNNILGRKYRNPDYIFEVLRWCPSLLELDFDTIFFSKKPQRVYGNRFPLRSLSVRIDHARLCVSYLKVLAPTLPELKQLHITAQCKQNINHRRPIKIEMPNIDFVLITWTYKAKTHLRSQKMYCYLQVKSSSQDRFFMASLDGLLPISEQIYSSAGSQLRVCIICRELRDFKLQISITTF